MISASDILHGRILIVDDQPANIELLERTLRDAGYDAVTMTMDPRQVCELHRRNDYDLILLDLEMPEMDGFQVMDGLKEIDPEGYLPVLAVTAYPAHKLRALYGGARDFISKPFDLAEVSIRVRNMVEVRLLHKAARHHDKMLESLALKDPLTGLLSGRLLTDRMEMALFHARRNKGEMAVVLLHLNGLAQVIEEWGHGAGDVLLAMSAGRLVAAVRGEDVVARLSGGEFAISLWSVGGAADAGAAAAKVIEAVSQPCDVEGHVVSPTACAGVAIYPGNGTEADTLLKSAAQALCEASLAGKNVYRIAAAGRTAGTAAT